MSISRIVKAPSKVLKSMYDWTLKFASTTYAMSALFCIAFVESSFFPIPPDVLLIAMVVAKPARWALYALICTAGSVIGALFGYLIGWVLFETVGQAIIHFYHLQSAFETVRHLYADNAFLAIFTAAFTPIPYKVFTIAAGAFQISIPVLILSSILGRAGRFFLVAGLLRIFGQKVSRFIEKHFDWLSIVFVLCLVGGYFGIKLLAHSS